MISEKADVFEFDPGNEGHQKIEEVDELNEYELQESLLPSTLIATL